MNNSFVFYESFAEALSLVPEDEYAGCVKALLEYAFNGNDIAETQMEKIFMALVRPQLDANKKRRADGEKGKAYGSLGGRPKKETQKETTENPIGVINENPTGVTDETANVNVNVNANVNVNGKKNKRFTAPSVDEVREYCLERKNNIDPEAFVAFYESKGWKVGNTPMKDWKCAITTWERRQKAKAPPGKINKFQNFPVNEGNRDLTRQIMALQ